MDLPKFSPEIEQQASEELAKYIKTNSVYSKKYYKNIIKPKKQAKTKLLLKQKNYLE
jgi:hypothetical protein